MIGRTGGTGMRPRSIIWFERLYGASFVLGLVSTAQNWTSRNAVFKRNPLTQDLVWLTPVTSVAGAVIAVAVWYLVARRGSAVAKWLVVLFAAFGGLVLAFLVFGLANGRGDPVNLLVGVIQNVAYIFAAVQLFKPDAAAWFGETREATA